MARHARIQSSKSLPLLAILVAMLAFASVVPSKTPAVAAEFDVAGQTLSFNEVTQTRTLFRSNTTTVYAPNANSGTAGETVGDKVLYEDVIRVNGTSIDALVEYVAKTGTVSVNNFDGGTAVSGAPAIFQTDLNTSAGSSMQLRFTFYEAGTYDNTLGFGTSVVLKNVLVNSYDLDGSSSGSYQFTSFSGFQEYTRSSITTVDVVSTAGRTDFIANNLGGGGAGYTAASGSYDKGRVQVKYSYLSTLNVSIGVTAGTGSGGISYFALDFGVGQSWPVGTQVTVSNSAANRAPTSTSERKFVSSTGSTPVEISDFGSFNDLDSNPFVKIRIDSPAASGTLERYNGSAWVPVSVGDEISTSVIRDGGLRYTYGGSAGSEEIKFSVHDGLVYSASSYTLTLEPTANNQTITFTQPGNQGFSQTFDSGASASSGLTVTLVSNTPTICTVSGLNIVTRSLAGDCSITASQAGNSTNSAAPSVTRVFPVSGAPVIYTLTFSGNSPGGGSVPSNITGSGSKTLPGNTGTLTKTGFTFGGWTIGGVDYAAGDSYTLSSNVTATAIWNAVGSSYTLTFNGNSPGGGSVPSNITGSGSKTLPGNTGTLTKTGFTFGGWTIGGVDYAAGASYNLSADVTATAIWNAVGSSYTLTFNGNSPGGGSVPADITGSGAKTIPGNTGTLTKTGFTFGGWTIGGVDYAAGASYNLSADATATAIWTPIGGGGSAPPADSGPSLNFGAPTSSAGTLPPTQVGSQVIIPGNIGGLVRRGHTFAGWTIDGVDYPAGSRVVLTTNKTAFAYWIPNSMVFIDPTTNRDLLPKKSEVDSVVLPSSASKPGFVLVGWKVDGTVHPVGKLLPLSGASKALAVWKPGSGSAAAGAGGQLANTGFEMMNWLAFGLLLMASGSALMIYARRRVS